MVRLTVLQLQALRFIDRYSSLEGFPPTRRELAVHMGWSAPSTAQDAIERLERKGLVERKRFGIVRLTKFGSDVLKDRPVAA